MQKKLFSRAIVFFLRLVYHCRFQLEPYKLNVFPHSRKDEFHLNLPFFFFCIYLFHSFSGVSGLFLFEKDNGIPVFWPRRSIDSLWFFGLFSLLK